MQVWQLQTRPPHFIRIAQDPLGMSFGQTDQAVAPLFSTYCGSGLVIQSRARCKRTPMRSSSLRIASSLRRVPVSCCSKHISAANAKVYVERALLARRAVGQIF